MGGLGNPDFDAGHATVAYDSLHGTFLVAWTGNDTGTNFEIHIQLLAYLVNDLIEIGTNDRRISAAGVPAGSPAAAYDATRNEYAVVWNGSSSLDSEISLQRLTHKGAETAPDDLLVSDMGGGSNAFDATNPALAVGPGAWLLVAWQGNDNTGGLAVNEVEIFGQLLDLSQIFADGLESGDFSAWAFKQP
jgi:hypothetical protein